MVEAAAALGAELAHIRLSCCGNVSVLGNAWSLNEKAPGARPKAFPLGVNDQICPPVPDCQTHVSLGR